MDDCCEKNSDENDNDDIKNNCNKFQVDRTNCKKNNEVDNAKSKNVCCRSVEQISHDLSQTEKINKNDNNNVPETKIVRVKSILKKPTSEINNNNNLPSNKQKSVQINNLLKIEVRYFGYDQKLQSENNYYQNTCWYKFLSILCYYRVR